MAKGAESMNTEYCRGSCAEEKQRFQVFAEQIVALQDKQTSSRGQSVQRGFHGKAHGCVYAQVVPLETRDPRTRFGVFAEGLGPHPAWVRFSNGVGWHQPDDELDARGMAVKLMGIAGERLSSDETQTQDFLMTNAPTPVGRDAEEFMEFAHVNEKGRLPGLGFLLSHPNTAAPALVKTGPIDSVANAQYWGGGAFHLGAHQAVKVTAKPCQDSKPRPKGKRDDPDYLKKDLAAAAQNGLCFTMYVQFQVSPGETPIEHASYEWKESVSPLVPVANIVIPAQTLDMPGKDAFCESLSFQPWHGILAHQPMGHINRARKFVYDASRVHRKGGLEPRDFQGFDGAPASMPAGRPESR